MKSYLDILYQVTYKGTVKENRTGVDTLVIPPQFFSHDMRDGFPLVTTKKVAKKAMLVELEGFIGGITSKKWYQERGCNIWNDWCNPYRALRDADPEKRMKPVDDLGPIYGFQWRAFGGSYNTQVASMGMKITPSINHTDQLAIIVQTLHDNPNDRRMVCSAWNPNQLSEMALPACHLMFVVQHINGVLHLHWTQRSCDMFLGVPFNIASYGMLLTLLAKQSGMEAGTLNGTLVDCHLYENHYEQAKLQLQREPRRLPTVWIDNWTNIWDWKHDDVTFEGYRPHPAIKGAVAV